MRPWLRVCIAGFLGGVAMFLWASIAHLATPLASTGIGQIGHETALLKEMRTALGDQSGLYLYPQMNGQGDAATKAYEAKLRTSPSGVLIYHPPGASMLTSAQIVTEFLGEFAQALIVAVLLAWAAIAGYWSRVGFVGLVGLAAVLTTNLSYWNWYGFPGGYALAYAGTEWIGYIAAALVIAAVLPRNIPDGLWRVSETELAISISNGG